MISSLQRLPGKRLEQTLQASRRAVLEVKGRQRTSAKSGQLAHEVKTLSTWDATGSITNSTKTLTVELTAEAEWPSAVPLIDFFFNGTAPANRPTVGRTGRLTYQSGSIYAEVVRDHDTSKLEEENKLVWKYRMICSGTTTYAIKVRLRSNRPGSLTVGVA